MVIESECGVHNNTETSYLIRDFDLGVSNFNKGNQLKRERGNVIENLKHVV